MTTEPTPEALAAGIAAAQRLSWTAGWSLILAGMIAGAALGLFFGRADFLGGYGSWRRRLLRLGHIALIALGGLNLAASFASWSDPGAARLCACSLLLGGLGMPLLCALSAWRPSFRHAFFLPVTSLVVGVVTVLARGSS